jgi:hypothetical protein
MPRYLISFDAHAMDHIPADEMPSVARDAHEVLRDAASAGVWVIGAGFDTDNASVVATDGNVTVGMYPPPVGGFAIIDVASREQALEWAARIAAACRCAQEVREFMADPEQDQLLSQSRQATPADR